VTISPSATTCTNVTTPVAMPSTVALGGILALRATVQPSTSVFTVNFKDQNNNVIGSANTRSGTATYNWNTSGQSAGTYQVKAYVGNTCSSAASAAVTITGGGGVGALTFTVTASGVPLAGVEITVDGTVRGVTGLNGALSSPVSGLTLGTTHTYSAAIQGYTTRSGSKLLTTDFTVSIDMVTGAGAGGDSGSGMIIGLLGVAGLAMMMTAKK